MGEGSGVGAREAFGDWGVEPAEVVEPVLRDGAVGGAPVHRDGLEEVVAGAVEVALVYQFGAVEGAIVVREGVVVGLSEEAVGTGDYGNSVERLGKTVNVYRHVCGRQLLDRTTGDAVALCGVDNVEAVAAALNNGHMRVLAGCLLHSQSHAAGVAHEDEVAALQMIPLCVGCGCKQQG